MKRPRKFTKRKSATGKPYPQCQEIQEGKQCERSTYANGKCWAHYMLKRPR